MKRFESLLTIAAITAAIVSCRPKQEEPEPELHSYASPDPYEIVQVKSPDVSGDVRNVILMIGDGMGLEQVSCAWTLNKGKLNLDNMPVVGLSRTYSTSRLITDSAAGGTALASGVKTANGHVGTDPEGNPLESLLEKARDAGMKTGVAVTCLLYDATPADFCCQDEDRYHYDEIVADYLECGFDYIVGGGLDHFRELRADGRDIVDEMARAGYNVALTRDELMQGSLPLLGVLDSWNLPVALERGDLFRDMVSKGIRELDAASGGKGFAMMIEGSCIDDWLHENRIDLAMEELFDFDRTLGDVLEWAAADGHTLVVVTADHATGALTLQGGNLANGQVRVAFGNDSHNGIAVPYYVFGPGADNFSGILENAELGAILKSFIK